MPTNPTESQQEASRENGKLGGRPKQEKVKRVRKNIPMSFAVTPEEREDIKAQADGARLTLSEYCRRRVLGYKVVSKSDQEQTALLMKITGLLKHIHNQSNGAYSDKTSLMLNDVHGVIRELNR